MESLLKSFRIEPLILLFNGILFLVLVQVLDKLFWKPILRHLDRRRQDIADAYRTVDDTRREMEDLRGEYQTRLASIESEARGRIQQTVREAQKQREQMIAEARAQAEETGRRGAASIEQEREKMLAELRGRFDEAAEIALSKVIGASPDGGQKKLIDEYITQRVVQA